MNGESSAVLFHTIRSSHWNVNVEKGLREEQQRRLAAKGAATAPEDRIEYAPPPGPPPRNEGSVLAGIG